MGFLLVASLPWTQSMFFGADSYVLMNCHQDDIDIRSGRVRYRRYLYFALIAETTRDSVLSLALARDDAEDIAPDWHPAITKGPGLPHIHYIFHGALSQVHSVEEAWKWAEFSPEAKRIVAKRVLELWQEGGNDDAADAYIYAVTDLALDRMGATVDVADLPEVKSGASRGEQAANGISKEQQ